MPQTENCPDCDQLMDTFDEPNDQAILSVFGFEVIVRRWKKTPYCVECASERSDRINDRMFEHAAAVWINEGQRGGGRHA